MLQYWPEVEEEGDHLVNPGISTCLARRPPGASSPSTLGHGAAPPQQQGRGKGAVACPLLSTLFRVGGHTHPHPAECLGGGLNLKECLKTSELITSSDPDFIVLEDGSVYTTDTVSLSTEKKTFTILLKDIQEHEQKKIHVTLLAHQNKAHETRHTRDTVLKRSKRRWAPIPSTVMENSLGPFPLQIQQMVSDTAQNYTIHYSIRGPGVDKDPRGLFYIERETGNLFVTAPIDREQYPEFQIICFATTPDGYTPEIPLVHIIRVEDDNDNPPVFNPDTVTFCVPENSRSGTAVGQMTATDRDEIYTLHTTLKYRIVSQSPPAPRLFSINQDTGVITVANLLLDRELSSLIILLIEARDMAGQPFGLCTTGTASIELKDVNDNAPYFTKKSYVTEVFENTIDVEILRMSVEDLDERGSPSWFVVFIITRGNEGGYFKIVTDEQTNEGVLCVVKGLDYETTKEVHLDIVVNNADPYAIAPNTRALSTSTCTVVVKVKDIDEGPVFNPCVYIINVNECEKPQTLVGRYHAQDPETGNSEGIRYGILNDPCSWISIDEITGELRTVRPLDRDAPDMRYNQCNVTVCATDRSGKTGTGIVVVNLIDENDNFPVIVKKDYIICRDRKPLCITAVDADRPPHTTPFRFEFNDNRAEKYWRLISHDEKSAYLQVTDDAPFDRYKIPIKVYDNRGHSGVTDISVYLCDCTTPSDCINGDQRARLGSSITLGIWAIITMIGGSLLLLLILITLCACWGGGAAATKHVCDDSAHQNLIISNTEAPGEEVMVSCTFSCRNMGTLGSVDAYDIGAGMSTSGVKTGGQSFEMVKKGGGHHALESVKDGEHHIITSVKRGGHHTLDRGYEQPMMETNRYSYSEWQNFTQPRLCEESIRGHTLIKN
uniref:Cadherin domain-containing protein n=1 Tax=Sphenodon punctatus TaxID=8508 RepID=A0A8D0H3G7_SPHPU